MTTPKISIIIPIYNAEKYLCRCLDSVLNQTFTDWECLLVDDGSIDCSGGVIREYESKDTRFRVFHKDNGGVSTARNLGLGNAQGEWVTFLDADDALEEIFLEKLIQNDADLIVGAYRMLDAADNQIFDSSLGKQDFRNESEWREWLPSVITDQLFLAPWAKFFKRCIIGDMRFLESQRLGEDVHFIHRYLKKCKTITVTDEARYIYLQSSTAKYLMSLDDSLWHLANIYASYIELNVISPAWAKFHIDLFWEISKEEIAENPRKWFCTKYVQHLYSQASPYYTWRKRLKIQLYRIPYVLTLFHRITGKYF